MGSAMSATRYFQHHRTLFRENPTSYVSITIDAADQADFHLPHWAESDKYCETSAYKIRHVVRHPRPSSPMAFIGGNQCKEATTSHPGAFWGA
jgi:hypothetical protein